MTSSDFCARLFVDELIFKGFGNYDLRLRLNQLKFLLKAVMDFKLELNIHQGGMTKEMAIAYMTRGGFQTEAEAISFIYSRILQEFQSEFFYLNSSMLYWK